MRRIKDLEPSEYTVTYLKKRVDLFDKISSFTQIAILLAIPSAIMLYPKSNLLYFAGDLILILLLALLWIFSTRKRNHLRVHYNTHVWLVDLLKYPDKVNHDY